MAKNVLVKPLITEKMTRITEQLGKYGFVVDKSANKIEIKNAIEEMYGVTVESVNTLIMPSKQKRRYTRTSITEGKTKVIKKAIVTLAEGETIDFYQDI